MLRRDYHFVRLYGDYDITLFVKARFIMPLTGGHRRFLTSILAFSQR